jgi:hypothetical protein
VLLQGEAAVQWSENLFVNERLNPIVPVDVKSRAHSMRGIQRYAFDREAVPQDLKCVGCEPPILLRWAFPFRG